MRSTIAPLLRGGCAALGTGCAPAAREGVPSTAIGHVGRYLPRAQLTLARSGSSHADGRSEVSDATNLFAGCAVYNINDHWRVDTLLTHGDATGTLDNSLVSFDARVAPRASLARRIGASRFGRVRLRPEHSRQPARLRVGVAYPNDR
jgi:hypothetical protein